MDKLVLVARASDGEGHEQFVYGPEPKRTELQVAFKGFNDEEWFKRSIATMAMQAEVEACKEDLDAELHRPGNCAKPGCGCWHYCQDIAGNWRTHEEAHGHKFVEPENVVIQLDEAADYKEEKSE